MKSEQLYEMAMAKYVAALRAGNATPYECLRFFESSFRCREDDTVELNRLAILALIRHDPLLLITNPMGRHVVGLSETDVDSCVSGWDIEDEQLGAMLEGHLRMAAASRESTNDDQVTKALAALERAEPKFGAELVFLELYTAALEELGDPRYPAAVDELLKVTPEEWRSHPISYAMKEAVDREDWDRYDVLRQRWAELPRNAHSCECATNYVSNVDGLRALQRGDQAEALSYLKAAVAVAGCPHLNTGAASLLLAEELLDLDVAVPEVVEHLKAVEQYCVTDETTELRARIEKR